MLKTIALTAALFVGPAFAGPVDETFQSLNLQAYDVSATAVNACLAKGERFGHKGNDANDWQWFCMQHLHFQFVCADPNTDGLFWAQCWRFMPRQERAEKDFLKAGQKRLPQLELEREQRLQQFEKERRDKELALQMQHRLAEELQSRAKQLRNKPRRAFDQPPGADGCPVDDCGWNEHRVPDGKEWLPARPSDLPSSPPDKIPPFDHPIAYPPGFDFDHLWRIV